MGLKFSCKGIQRDKLRDVFETFLQVLNTGENKGATNVGFRARNNTMFTYQQYR